MTFDFASAHSNLLGVHNLHCNLRNLLIENDLKWFPSKSIGGMPIDACWLNCDRGLALSIELAVEFCGAYRALDANDPLRGDFLESFWGWSDLAD